MRTPLDRQEVEKVVLRVRGAFDITEEEIDSWNRLYSEGMDNEYARAVAVCFHHDYRKNISDNLRDFSRVMEGKPVEQCLLTAEKQYKYGLIRMRREQIIELREYYRCRNAQRKYAYDCVIVHISETSQLPVCNCRKLGFRIGNILNESQYGRHHSADDDSRKNEHYV